MSKFQLVKGNVVPNLEGIEEGYSLKDNGAFQMLYVNVSAERIDEVFRELCKQVAVPGFFLLEHGTIASEEEKLRTSDQDPFHKDVFYLDGLTYEGFLCIYEKYQELLIHDGEISYGFGSHQGVDEVYVGAYKVFYVYAEEIEKYETALKQLGIPRVNYLKTVWENFSQEQPGSRMIVVHEGKNIYQMVEELKAEGLYLAERRED